MADNSRRMREAGETLIDTAPAALPFWTFEKLERIEKGIEDAAGEIYRNLEAICKGLYQIQTRELYRDAGLADFKAYIEAERLTLAAPTLYEYARIGRALTEYAPQLEEHGYKANADGLKKVLYIDQAIKRTGRKADVFKHLKNDSYRDFVAYAKGTPPAIMHVHNEKPAATIQEGQRLLDALRAYLDKTKGKTRADFMASLDATLEAYRGRK